MALTTDLGFAMARCSIIKEGLRDEDSLSQLTVCEPSTDDTAAASITIYGQENINALYYLIRDAFQEHEEREELAKNLPPGG